MFINILYISNMSSNLDEPEQMAYDRSKPFNELPLLPPQKAVEEDIDVLKKLVTAARALASTNSNIHRLPNPTMLVNTCFTRGADLYCN